MSQVRYHLRETLAASGRAWQAADACPPRWHDCAAALQTTIRDAQAALAALGPCLSCDPCHHCEGEVDRCLSCTGEHPAPEPAPEPQGRTFVAPAYLR